MIGQPGDGCSGRLVRLLPDEGAPYAAPRVPTRSAPTGRTTRGAEGAPRSWILIMGLGDRSPKCISGVVMGRKARFSGAGRRREAAPSAARVAAAPVTSRACAWSLGRCWLSLGPGSRFVRGSWSRMRHQSAAAGWWSASGTAAAAGDTSRVAFEAGLGEVVQPFCLLRQEWVCGGGRGFGGQQLPPSPIPVVGGEPLVELLLEDSGGAAELGWPGGRRSLGSIWVAARHTWMSAISLAGTAV
jgi:hypothetical protein